MTAYNLDGRPLIDPPGMDPAELAAGRAAVIADRAATDAAAAVIDAAREGLADVLALAALYPFGTVEETAIVDTQAVAALAAYRALDDPPADVTSLASAVVAWRVAL